MIALAAPALNDKSVIDATAFPAPCAAWNPSIECFHESVQARAPRSSIFPGGRVMWIVRLAQSRPYMAQRIVGGW
jgi:hypothetical protein